ncbi:MAG: hypothetical protein IH897_15115 [Planctomycetes bacterium]|nr:hypothetical protein [Planctomycetota bacterium]MCH8243923.1 hypothetical protein [Planctomycetota bacterium]
MLMLKKRRLHVPYPVAFAFIEFAELPCRSETLTPSKIAANSSCGSARLPTDSAIRYGNG